MNKKLLFLLIISSSVFFLSCKHNPVFQFVQIRLAFMNMGIQNTRLLPKHDSIYGNIITPTTFYPQEFNEQGRIYYYTKLFGLMKYCTDGNINHDINLKFIENYDEVKNANTKEQFNHLINSIFISSKHKKENNTSNQEIDWLQDSNYFDYQTANTITSVCNYSKKDKNKYLSQSKIGLVRLKDKDKPKDFDDLFPSEATRVWGMINYWNYINYFWINKPLMDENWDFVLYSQIPNLVSAGNAQEYNLAVMKFIAYTDDCHSIVRSEIIDDELFGRNIPRFNVKKIDDNFVITKRRNGWTDIYGDTLIRQGDILLTINDINVNKLYDSVQIYFAASNKWTKERIVVPHIRCSHLDNNQVTLLRNDNIDTIEIEFEDYKNYWKYNSSKYKIVKRQMPVIHKQQTAYVHIDDLFLDNFNKTMKALRKADNIIFDIRDYPNQGVTIKLLNYLLPWRTEFYHATYPDVKNIGTIKRTKGDVGGRKHAFKNKKIVLIVNEHTQSQAEYLVMALQQLENVTTIGSCRSAGADGNVIFFNLPGKIKTSLSGGSILYPDGTITQRAGVKIDYLIEPTVEDYQMNRDAALDFAYDFLQ